MARRGGWAAVARSRALWLALGAVAGVPAAQANGRYPAAGLVAAHPSDAKILAIRATYGLVLSEDGGGHWRWLCEEAVPLAGQLDPFAVYASNSNLLVTSALGLRTALPGTCSWSGWTQPGGSTTYAGVDIARDPGQGLRAVALVHAPGLADRVQETQDGGGTWQALGQPLPPGHEALTLDVAPGGRLYASSRTTTTGLQHWTLRSDDGAKTWQALPFGPTPADSPPTAIWIGAVAPGNSQRLWLRAQVEEGDQLWQSDDGAQTWTLRLKTQGKLLGFAVSPDGSQIAAGLPGTAGGLWRGAAAGGPLDKVNGTGVRCLTWTAAGLYVCADEASAGFTLGRSTDGGTTLAPLFRAATLTPLLCNNASANVCQAGWPFVQSLLAAPATATTGGPTAKTPADEGCQAGRHPSWGPGLGLLALALLVLRRRRGLATRGVLAAATVLGLLLAGCAQAGSETPDDASGILADGWTSARTGLAKDVSQTAIDAATDRTAAVDAAPMAEPATPVCFWGAPPAPGWVGGPQAPGEACPGIAPPAWFDETKVPAPTLDLQIGWRDAAGTWHPYQDGDWVPLYIGTQGFFHMMPVPAVQLPGETTPVKVLQAQGVVFYGCNDVAAIAQSHVKLGKSSGSAGPYTLVPPAEVVLIFAVSPSKIGEYCGLWYHVLWRVRIPGTDKWGQTIRLLRTYVASPKPP
ncbi:MAG: exo-alpha-sialidase [Deltaproteobacteria bacterium]|nr:exo-alpha-sialidase [Deltaproteobacteria bacterium]